MGDPIREFNLFVTIKREQEEGDDFQLRPVGSVTEFERPDGLGNYLKIELEFPLGVTEMVAFEPSLLTKKGD